MANPPQSDVSAVVLTLGEPTTREVLDSLGAQSLAPREIILIEAVSPFHRALNAGVARVRTRFFVQVDADMVLDRGCIAELRRHVRWNTGIVVGQLRDPLVGRVVGVKLFRTRCFRIAAFRDSISPDTDFGGEIAAAGWQTVYIGQPRHGERGDWTTYGEHRPPYSPLYTYRKYVLEGRRYRHRSKPSGIRWHFQRLEKSAHPCALVAQIGLAHGIFLDEVRDRLGVLERDEEFDRLDRFLHHPSGPGRGAASDRRDDGAGGHRLVPATDQPPGEIFRRFQRQGQNLFAASVPGEFARAMNALGDTRRNDAAWIAKVALCHGLVMCAADDRAIQADWQTLGVFMGTEPDEGGGTTTRWWRTVTLGARLLLPRWGGGGHLW